MPYKVPTTEELTKRNLANIESALNCTTPPGDKAFNSVIAAMQGMAFRELYNHSNDLIRESFALTASESGLELIGREYGISRKQASSWEGEGIFDIPDGETLNLGTPFISSGGQLYETTATVTAPNYIEEKKKRIPVEEAWAYYSCDNFSSIQGVLKDDSGNGRDMNMQGTVQLADGVQGKGLKFGEKSGMYGRHIFAAPGDFTWALWVNFPKGPASGSRCFIGNQETGGACTGVLKNSTNTIYVDMYCNGYIQHTFNAPDNEWLHIIIKYIKTENTLVVKHNNVEVIREVLPAPFSWPAIGNRVPFALGGNPGPVNITDSWCNGGMADEVYIFQRLTTEEEDAAMYELAPPGRGVKAPIKSVLQGHTGNLSAGNILTIQAPIPGAGKTMEVIKTNKVGTALEDIQDFRERILEEGRAVSGGGNAYDYRLWAQSVTGVKRAYPFSGPPEGTERSALPGERTVYIECTKDINSEGIPPLELLELVKDALIFDPLTGFTRELLGLSRDTLYVEPIKRTVIYVNLRGVVVQGNLGKIEAGVKEAVKTFIEEYRPYVEGVDIEQEKRNVLSSSMLIREIQNILDEYQGTVQDVMFGLEGETFVRRYDLKNNEKLKLGEFTFRGVTYD